MKNKSYSQDSIIVDYYLKVAKLNSQDSTIVDYYLKVAKLAVRKASIILDKKGGANKNHFQEFKGFDFDLRRIKREFESKLKNEEV